MMPRPRIHPPWCAVYGCARPGYTMGLCRSHYEAERRAKKRAEKEAARDPEDSQMSWAEFDRRLTEGMRRLAIPTDAGETLDPAFDEVEA